MPDTGAPWNIPYVDPTDLVRDYPQASEDLADAIADGLTAAGNAGIGTNVASTLKTDEFSASVSAGGFAAVTGLTVSLTPTVATAKVLVMGYATVAATAASASNNRSIGVLLKRNGTPIAIGNASGARSRVTTGEIANAAIGLANASWAFVDSPAIASSVTYSVEVFNGESSTRTLVVNRNGDTTNTAEYATATSSITVIEVAV
jgi:hypothetical protein